jgi:hypothetical protein
MSKKQVVVVVVPSWLYALIALCQMGSSCVATAFIEACQGNIAAGGGGGGACTPLLPFEGAFWCLLCLRIRSALLFTAKQGGSCTHLAPQPSFCGSQTRL